MSVVVSELAIRTPHGNVYVKRAHDDCVKVTWMCGDARTLTHPMFEQACKTIKTMADHPDAWFVIDCSSPYGHGQVFARISEGQLYVDSTSGSTGAASVRWRDLRKAIERAFREEWTAHE